MGYDVTYHPFAAEEINHLYFDSLSDHQAAERLAARFGLKPEEVQALAQVLEVAGEVPKGTPFNKGHGYCMALVAGFLRKYWYVRGGAFSFVLEDHPEYQRYVQDWKELLPAKYVDADFIGEITQNHCSGVFLGSSQLQQLKTDFGADSDLRSAMEETFGETLQVFWKAVDFAIANGLGLIEATDLYCPHPFQPDVTRTLLPVRNCELDGVKLYMRTAAEQLKQIEALKTS